MTKDDILSMASESYCWRLNLSSDRTASLARLQRFAELVAAAERNRTWTQDHWTEYERSIAATEREECAKVCDAECNPTPHEGHITTYQSGGYIMAEYLASAIRARGQG
jgi:hypothetical protein